MSQELNRRSTDNAPQNSNTPEWMSAVVTLAPIAMSFIQMIMTLVNARPPKRVPTSAAMPFVDNGTTEPATTR